MSGSTLHFITIDVAGAANAAAYAITPSGEILGEADVGGPGHGFIYNSGTTTLLEVPGASFTYPVAISASGVVVGGFTTGTINHGFIWNAGTFTTLDYPGALNTQAVAINASGEVVGHYGGTSGDGSFVLNDGTYSSINVPGGHDVEANAINDAGQIVGVFFAPSNTLGADGFVKTGGTVSTIVVPGAVTTFPVAINATGTIAGWSDTAVGQTQGFLDVGGTITTFEPPGAVSNTTVGGITDSGTIYGHFTNAGGTTEGFVGTPGTFTEYALPGATSTEIVGIDAIGEMVANVDEQAVLMVEATPVHWVAGSGSFDAAADWNPQVVPGATNDAIIDAGGTYTVTAATSETVSTLAMVAGATLVVSGGTFTVSFGSGTGGLAGSIAVDAGAVLALAGSVDNTGTITIAGQLEEWSFGLSNSGTVDADGSAALAIDLGSGNTLENSASGLVEATGGLTIAGGAVSNDGTVNGEGAAGLTIDLGSGNTLENSASGLIEATGMGGLTIAAGAVGNAGTVNGDGAAGLTIDLGSGNTLENSASGLIEATGMGGLTIASGTVGNGGTVEASLVGIASGATLALEAGSTFSATSGIADSGMVQLSGAALTVAALTVAAGGQVSGFGTITDTLNAISVAGTIAATAGTLAIASAIDPASTGLFQIGASSVLEVAADQGSADTISFVGAGGELIIGDVGQFGLNVGTPSYTGPRIEDFANSDSILLTGLAPAGLVPAYDAATGLLQIGNGSTNVASLRFDTASLGAGSFLIESSGGQALLTYPLATEVHWVGGNGDFNTAANWSPQVVPVASIDAIIDAAGTYTVTAGASEAVASLAMVAGATLVVSAGTFTASNGSEAGGLAGSIVVDAGAVLALAGSVLNTGTIAGAGQVGVGGLLNLTNEGTVNANGTAGLTIDAGTGEVVNYSTALVEATGSGGLTVAGGTLDNLGTMLAANGSALTFGAGAVNANNRGGVLSRGTLLVNGSTVVVGGTWEADNGSTLAVTGGAVEHDGATIILSGAGSAFSAGDGSTFTDLAASLTGINPVGTLALDAGAGFAAANQIADFGVIALGGGTLTAPRLALGAIGQVSGFGTLAASSLSNGGTIDANSDTALTLDPDSGQSVQNLAGGLIEATEDGGLAIAGGTVDNFGTMLAVDGSTLTFQSGVVNQNNTGGVLRGGRVGG